MRLIYRWRTLVSSGHAFELVSEIVRDFDSEVLSVPNPLRRFSGTETSEYIVPEISRRVIVDVTRATSIVGGQRDSRTYRKDLLFFTNAVRAI